MTRQTSKKATKMDTRYRDRGYTTTVVDQPYGTFVTIKKGDKVVGEFSVGFFQGGMDAKAQIIVKRFQQGELHDVQIVDEFEDD
jgi:hypothetical protein